MQTELIEKKRMEPNIFSNVNLPTHGDGHSDSLVVIMDIIDTDVEMVLVNTSKNINILYHDVFVKVGINSDKQHPILTPLFGFTRDSIEA